MLKHHNLLLLGSVFAVLLSGCGANDTDSSVGGADSSEAVDPSGEQPDYGFDTLQLFSDTEQNVLTAAPASGATIAENEGRGNLLLNSQFDSGMENWFDCSRSLNNNSRSSEVNGDGDLLIDNGCIYQAVQISAGERLTVSCSAKTNDVTQWSGIGISFSDRNWLSRFNSRVAININSPTMRAYTRTISAPVHAYYAVLWASSNGQAVVDQCELIPTPIASLPGDNLDEENESDAATNNHLVSADFSDHAVWSECTDSVQEPRPTFSDGVLTMDAANSCLFQTIATEAGDQWTLSCDAMTSPSTTYAELNLSALDPDGSELLRQHTELNTNQFTEYSLSIATPEGASTIAVAFYAEGWASFTNCVLSKNVEEETPIEPARLSNFPEVIAEADVRFLNQATLGTSPDLLRSLEGLNYEQWIDQQMSIPAGGNHHQNIFDIYAQLPADNKFKTGLPNVIGLRGQSFGYLHNYLWQQWIEGSDQYRKRMAAALQEIFVINDLVGPVGALGNALMGASYLDMLEENAFGNFRTLLERVTLHPAMGEFLTYEGNRKAEYDSDGNILKAPDENYAREVLQLFSIGLYELNINGKPRQVDGNPVETYTQDDINGLARVFTGWGRDNTNGRTASWNLPMKQYPARHSSEEKSFLGVTIPEGTEGVESLRIALDTIADHPNVATFIGKQLIQRLVTSNPSNAYVRRVAAVFNADENGERGNLGAVFKAILLDEEARAADGGGADFHTDGHFGKLREPMMRLTAIARMLEIKTERLVYPIGDTTGTDYGLGQTPFRPRVVFNFFRPGYTPAGSELASMNLVAPEMQIVSGSATLGYMRFLHEMFRKVERGFQVNYGNFTELADDSRQLVERLNTIMTAGTLSSDTINEAVAALDQLASDDPIEKVKTAISLVAYTPAFLIQK